VNQTRPEITEAINKYSLSIKRLQRIAMLALGLSLVFAGLSTLVEWAALLRGVSAISVLICLSAVFLIGILTSARGRLIGLQ
jgi:uncharacterized RDD family membrane protein YckC